MQISLLRHLVPLAAPIVLCGLSIAFALEVEHHGFPADTEGTAAYCLTCHDGSVGKKIVVCSTPCINPNTHKMLIPYPPPGKRGYASREAVLMAGLKLEGEMITCITCHDLTNPLRYHFAVDATPYAQKLCYVCHLEIDDLDASSRHIPAERKARLPGRTENYGG